MEEQKSCKVYVDVGVEFTAEGKMRPSWIRWTDGHIFQIDRVKQVCRGGQPESRWRRSALYRYDQRTGVPAVLRREL